MFTSMLKKLAGTKMTVVAAGAIVLAGAGVAGAAAADIAPWQADAPVATSVPATIDTLAPNATAADTTVAPTSTASAVAEPAVPSTSVLAATEPVTTEPVTTEPATTEPVTTEPATTELVTTEPATSEPATTEPATTVAPRPKPDTSVPQGIELVCAVVDQVSVRCEWHGGMVEGFRRYLVLRSDGRVVFGTENPDIHTYLDQPGKAGSFSYVVISVDGNSKNLSHSNPVSVQVGSAT